MRLLWATHTKPGRANKNAGQQWRPKGDAIEVLTHDFPDPEVPKAVPYGVYDIGQNTGWVNVGMSSDTAEFAVESIRQWWKHMGRPRYPRSSPADLRGQRGQQRVSSPAVEARATGLRDGTETDDYGVSLSAWHEQMEQDRASPVLLHHDELEGSTVDGLSHHRQPHCRDQDSGWVYRQSASRSQDIQTRNQSFGARDESSRTRTPSLPRRAELHHQTTTVLGVTAQVILSQTITHTKA